MLSSFTLNPLAKVASSMSYILLGSVIRLKESTIACNPTWSYNRHCFKEAERVYFLLLSIDRSLEWSLMAVSRMSYSDSKSSMSSAGLIVFGLVHRPPTVRKSSIARSLGAPTLKDDLES